MKTKLYQLLLMGIFIFAGSYSSSAGTLIIQNLTADELAGYGLANSSGTLIPGNTTNNVRAGYFNISDSEVLNLWNAGNLAALNTSFVQFGQFTSMQDWDAGYNGLFQNSVVQFADPFEGKNIYLYISNGSNFTNSSGEYLIYKFTGTFTMDPFNGEQLLGSSPGTLLVGGYNNFQFDYGLGAGSLPAFNTVAVVPEPSALALFALGATLLALRQRRHML